MAQDCIKAPKVVPVIFPEVQMNFKIIHIISSLHRGGRERQLATIVSNTDFNRYASKIIVFNESENSYIDEYGLANMVIQVKAKAKIARLKMLHHILKNEKPDVVYTWGNGESVSTLLLKPLHRFVFVNGSIRHGIRSTRFSHYFRTLVLHLCRHVVANSHAGLRANNLKHGFVLYNGVDERFLAPLADAAAKRNELVRFPESAPIFVSVANLVPYKDYRTVIKAFEQIKQQGSEFHYLILGDGPLRKKTENLIKESQLEKNVTIIGNVENVHEYLKISDVMIHSSKGEGCSNAILEGMAAGLPVIATDTGGTPEVVGSRNGVLFKYECQEELVNILTDCMNNRFDWRNLGENARRTVQERFSLSRMIENYYHIIRLVSENG